ncbi:MAG: insulinase family protein [Dysgonamonadaceae bacterium]|jgi:predicted Zn-dependent peptidase|nr:insulinase family protein [Dysgonamonadaceae bacterium]
MKSIQRIFGILLCAVCSLNIHAQGLKAFQLPNGLQVFIWEDENMTDVTGMVTVNVGSKEDPENYTGLAHYLEHLLFKGNENIGTVNWEKEKPLYEQIIAKYDERAATTDPVLRDTLARQINRLSIEAAQYNMPNELSILIQNMGGENVNANTSFDRTVYFNSFPAGEIYKWLELYSERLIHPVFRNFQAELETVYEEFNRAQDEESNQEREFLQKTIFPGHPYSRNILGLPEHLKNPQLSKLIEFYETWYVPNNMALILIGNIKTNQVSGIIKQKFGRLERKELPERKQYPETPHKGRKEASAKLSQMPQLYLAFPGITASSPDDAALEICASILANPAHTGMIDKLVIDGDLLAASVGVEGFKERGSAIVFAIPYYDVNQRRFESIKSTEKLLWKEIKKLQEGKFEDGLVQSIKSDLIRRFDLQMESAFYRAYAITEMFINGRDMTDLLNYKERIDAVTTEEIKAAAKKYFGNDYYAIFFNEGKPDKNKKQLEKPDRDPVIPARNAESDYAKQFRFLPAKYAPQFADVNTVESRKINDRSRFFYTKNPENEIFSLILKFGIGTAKMPKLHLAVPLMNNAGIMAQMEAQEVKQEFSNLGTTCSYSVDENYLYVKLYGFETNLEASCNLMTRQILLPKLDEKQMNSQIGGYYQDRMFEKERNAVLNNAMLEYIIYKDKSKYLDRLELEKVIFYSVSELTGEFQRATDYEAEVHYVGNLPVDEVYDILSKNLPMKQGERATTSPEIRDRVDYPGNTIYFLPNSDAKQSAIFFYIQGDSIPKEQEPYVDAFNQYFGNGFFTDLVIQEIREYRSLAYTAYGNYFMPEVENKKAFFGGYVGTQSDKTLEAVEVYLDLLKNMPQYPDRMANIKSYLKENSSIEKPQFRSASLVYEAWRLRGYSESPAKLHQATIDKMTFDDIVGFYDQHIKGRPIAIAIVGNPKNIDLKALEKYGKVTKISASRIFSEK